MQNQQSLIMTIVVAAVVGLAGAGLGYHFGMTQQSSNGQNQAQGSRTGRGQGSGANGGQNRFGRGVMGQVTSVDNNTLTVKMPDGSSKIVVLSGTTSYEISTSSSKDAVTAGKTVRVIGNTNSDGSVTASYVMLNPQTFGPQGSGQPQPQNQGSM